MGAEVAQHDQPTVAATCFASGFRDGFPVDKPCFTGNAVMLHFPQSNHTF